jgi:membrane-associated phospholipid phosphatase
VTSSRPDTDGSAEIRQWIVVAIGAVAVAIGAAAVAATGDVPAWEAEIFHLVNDLPDWLERPMWIAQLAGLLLVPLILATIAAAFRRWWLVAGLVLLVPLKLAVEKLVVKQLVERERPATSICGYPDADVDACMQARDVPLEGLSFVSGHAVIAWGIATVLWPVLPGRWRWVAVGVAIANSVARVYLGAHNPLDVIGGGAIGVAIGASLITCQRAVTVGQARSVEVVGG